MKTVKKYLNLFHGVRIPWALLVILMITSIIEGQVVVRSVQITADIIDSYQNTIRIERLLRYLGYLAVMVACGVSSGWIGGIAYGKINRGVREKTFRHLLRLPQRFYDQESATEVVSRIIVDSGSSAYYFEILITTFGAVYTAVLVFVKLIQYNRAMGLYSLLIIPVAIGVGWIYGWFTFKAARKSVNSSAETTGYLFERTAAFRIVKAYNMQHAEEKSGYKMFRKMYAADMMSEMALAFVQVGMQIIGCVSIVISFVFGSILVKKELLTIGELVAFYNLSGSVGVQLINLFLNYGSFRSITGSVKNVVEILDMEEESTEGIPVEEETQDIHFEDVSFAYGETPVLKHVSFTIQKQKLTAIIGTNGAGKSTAFKLLQRVYDASEGVITYGDTDIREYSLPSWRDHFAVVSQSCDLISGTIRDNLCYGAKDPVSDERLIEIASLCGLKNYLESCEQGLDTIISVGSSNLSGGQKQALTIARAIVKNSPCLLLDEATKSLDASSEKIAIEALNILMKDRTTVMIAHNPSAVVNADYIIVLQDGEVADMGTPAQLHERCAYYRTFIGENT